ncbi:hypothetical protein BDY21DRAFT_418919 [Lineolata rhizophorae]|uniref:Uncharacterized protein n=1 Tax=Lineolata rhizophorae TaxID=578093 RepID=A0A6A6PAK1_9PEZI|nr:hypothetical protein BDY21DRAFT_418919 [Lineolata rhizophorae]
MAFVLGIIGNTISVMNLAAGFIPSSGDLDGGSRVRLGVGLDTSGGLSEAGGDVPYMRTYNANRDFIGEFFPGHREGVFGNSWMVWDEVDDGSFVDAWVRPRRDHEGQQPQYLELNMIADDEDGICLAYVTHVWPDGHTFGWIGDWGRHCGHAWYHSNIVIDDAGHKTACTWLDKNHDNHIKVNSLKLHMPSFGRDETNGGTAHSSDWYCHHPAAIQFFDRGDPLFWWVLEGRGIDGVAESQDQHEQQQPHAFSRRSESLAGRLIISNSTAHGATELCESGSSYGPDFVSLAEGQFCDMETHTLYPLCEDNSATSCFDVDSRDLRPADLGSVVARSSFVVKRAKYGKVMEWH